MSKRLGNYASDSVDCACIGKRRRVKSDVTAFDVNAYRKIEYARERESVAEKPVPKRSIFCVDRNVRECSCNDEGENDPPKFELVHAKLEER